MKVVVQLAGGMGNQLFQYAMGRALALRFGGSLVLDTRTGFAVDRRYRRSFELGHFRIPPAVKMHAPSLVGLCWNRFRHGISTRGVPLPGYLLENRLQGPMEPWSGTRRVLGYWQSETWFSDFTDHIREDLEWKQELPQELSEWALKLQQPISVAVHVRRVDYAKKLAPEYYERALTRMKEKVPESSFYFFSDDTGWCTENLVPRYGGEVVCHSFEEAVHDFRLMGLCRHVVIANSSFSWWAAWLGEKEGGCVIAPSAEIWDHPDILPKRWETINVTRQGEVTE